MKKGKKIVHYVDYNQHTKSFLFATDGIRLNHKTIKPTDYQTLALTTGV